jgi:hypothetical protein
MRRHLQAVHLTYLDLAGSRREFNQ